MAGGKFVSTLVAALALALPTAASGQSSSYPYGPEQSPPGANDFGCEPSAEHPEPVVLAHGLGANMAQNWGSISPRLADEGYCVFALTYGRTLSNPYPFDQPGGTGRMEESAEQLAALVADVLSATGAKKVDIVGHSEGSLMPNYYVKFLGGAQYVDDYVGLTPLWDGTDLAGLGTLSELGKGTGGPEAGAAAVARGCASCPQFLKGSDFMDQMNSGGGPRVEGVDYTMIMTRYDELVSPYTSGIMEGAVNIVVQDQCAADPSEHGAVAFDPVAIQDVLNALDPASAVPVSCATYFSGY